MALPLFHDDIDRWESAVSLRLNKAYLFDLYTKKGEGKSRLNKSLQPKSNKAIGVSEKAQKRIHKRVELLYSVAKMKTVYSEKHKKHFRYKLGFITLTLASKQVHTDSEIHYTCFAPFIREIKLKNKSFLFVWKAETQDNGNIHYHITTNTFIHKDWLRYRWNHWQNKLGYVDRYGQDNPPSTKIQPCMNVKGLAVYMAKYMSKNEAGRREVTIKAWDCSMALKTIKTSDFLSYEQELELQEFTSLRKQLTEKNLFGEIVPIKCYKYELTDIMKKQSPLLMEIWNKQVKEIKVKASQEAGYVIV